MTQIVLVRPGCTDFDQQGRIQGTLDIPLCEAGRQEVNSLVAELKSLGLEVIYTSPCRSAQETAQLLAKALQLKVKKLEKLRNLDHGLWQGMLIDDVKHKHPKVFRQLQERPENVCLPQGEVVEDAQARVQESLQKLLKKHRDDKIALVIPEPLAALVRSTLLSTPLADLWSGLATGAKWERIELAGGVLAAAT